MSLFPSAPDVFVDRTGAHSISSSDPNNAYDAIENIQNFVGASGEAQSKSVTIVNMFRSMLSPLPVSSYVGADTLSVEAAQIALFNGTDVVFKRNTAATTCNLSVDLLNGSEAGSTWYDLYMYGDSASTKFALGFLGQGTDPAVYMTYYQKINSIRNDGDLDITKFFQDGNYITWDTVLMKTIHNSSFTDVDYSVYVPSISQRVTVKVDMLSQGPVQLRRNGSVEPTGNMFGDPQFMGCSVQDTDENQIMELKNTGSGPSAVFIMGYYMNL